MSIENILIYIRSFFSFFLPFIVGMVLPLSILTLIWKLTPKRGFKNYQVFLFYPLFIIGTIIGGEVSHSLFPAHYAGRGDNPRQAHETLLVLLLGSFFYAYYTPRFYKWWSKRKK